MSIGGGNVKVEASPPATPSLSGPAVVEGSVELLLEPSRVALHATGSALLAVSLLTLPAVNLLSNVCGIGLGGLLLHNFKRRTTKSAAADMQGLRKGGRQFVRGLTELLAASIPSHPGSHQRRSGCCSPTDATGLAMTTAVFGAGELVAIGLAYWQLYSVRPSLLLPLALMATEPAYSSWLEALLWRWLASALAVGAGSAFMHIVLAGVAYSAMSALVKSTEAHVQARAHAARTDELLRAAGVGVTSTALTSTAPMDRAQAGDDRLLTGDPVSAPVPVPVLRSVSTRGIGRGADTPSVSAHTAALRRIGSSGRSASMSMREAALRGSVVTEPGLSAYERETFAMAGNGALRVGTGVTSVAPMRGSPLASPAASSGSSAFPGRLHTIHESGATSGGGETAREHFVDDRPPGRHRDASDHSDAISAAASSSSRSAGPAYGAGGGPPTHAAGASGEWHWTSDRDGYATAACGHTGSHRSSSASSQALPPLAAQQAVVPPLQMQQMRSPSQLSQSQTQTSNRTDAATGGHGGPTIADVRSALQRISSMRMAPQAAATPMAMSHHDHHDMMGAPDAAVEAVLQSAVQKLAAASFVASSAQAASGSGREHASASGMTSSQLRSALSGPGESTVRLVQMRGSGLGFSDDASGVSGGTFGDAAGAGGGPAAQAAMYGAPSLADLVNAVRAERAAGRM